MPAEKRNNLPFLPQYTNWPVCIPSVAINNSFLSLNLYGSLNATTAKGAPRPGS